MKKVFVAIALIGFTFSTISCRETTEEKMEDAAEAAGNDIEDGARDAGNAVENAADNAGNEIEEEVEGTDDYNGDDDN